MDDIRIDGQLASKITDRAIPPKGLGVAPKTIKSVLWCFRGLGAPGTPLSYDRQEIEARTCLEETAVKGAFRALKKHGILIQLQRPAPGRCAQFAVDYVQLSKWLRDRDREIVELELANDNPGATRPRTQAHSAHEHRRDAPRSKSTQARSAETQAHSAETQAHSAGDIKEEAAKPAIPAAAATRSVQLTADEQLTNLAAAAAAEIQGSDWARLGRRAGLDRDRADALADILVAQGISDGVRGRRVIERAVERGSQIRDLGAWATKFIQGNALDKTGGDRSRARKRERLCSDMTRFTPKQLDLVRIVTREQLSAKLGDEVASQLMPMGQWGKPIRAWDEMLDFLVGNWQEISAGVSERFQAEQAGAA